MVLAAPAVAAERLGTDRVFLLGCPIDAVTLEDAVQTIDARIAQRRPLQHAAVNAAKLVKLQQQPALRDAVSNCDLITADGQAVVWAGRLLHRPLPERVAGIDLMEALLALAAYRGYRVFLLGARPSIVERAAKAIEQRFPGIVLAGYHHGYYEPEDEAAVVAEIARAAPDLLFVARETPAKEIFLARHRDRLQIPFAMGVGGSLDVIAGLYKRAPVWLQRLGLEWAFRLAQDPRRLARRYLVGNTQFAWLVLRHALRRGAGAEA